MDLIYSIFILILIPIPFIQVVFSYLICVLYPNIILRIPLCIALILYPNIIVPIPLRTAYASLILYPNIILRIPLRIAYAFLIHSFDFIPEHHLTHSLTHSLRIPLCIALILYPHIILRIPLRIALIYTPNISYAFPCASCTNYN